MDNPRLLKLRVNDKLDEIEKLKDNDLRYDALENPSKLLKHYQDELKFFEDGRRSLARMIDTDKNTQEQEAFQELNEFYLNTYPKLELELLRVIQTLEKKTSSSQGV